MCTWPISSQLQIQTTLRNAPALETDPFIFKPQSGLSDLRMEPSSDWETFVGNSPTY